MIGVDWGTSSLRAWRLGPDGAVRARREVPGGGIAGIAPGGFPAALIGHLGDWLADGEDRLLLCGMVGSRQGWREVPYLPCPADAGDLAAALVPLADPALPAGARAWLVPGLSTRDARGVPDLMRGEETKLAGLAPDLPVDGATVLLPGTHPKWARLAGGRVTGFATHLTGEAFAALSAHTMLRHAVAGGDGDAGGGEESGWPAFEAGLDRAGDGLGLLHHLFGVRARSLVDGLAPAAARAHLSGLLIGHELRAALADAPPGPVHLLGAPVLVARYARALARLGREARPHDADAAARGLHRLSEGLP